MNNAKHEWCQDVSRDEAVRAAEDAAAVPSIQHRDLPEQVALLWASVGDILGRIVRIEGEIDAGKVEAVEAVPPPDPAFPGEGMRTERVTLEFHIEGSPPTQWPWSYILNRSDAFKMRPGESVRVVEETRGERLPDMVAWITAERDAAQAERDAARAEAERLRDRVAELEAAAKTAALLAEVRESEWRVASELAAEANAENAGGEAKQEPVAWGVRFPDGKIVPSETREWAETKAKEASDRVKAAGVGVSDAVKCVPLYAAPPEPRGWLTAEERAAVGDAATTLHQLSHFKLSLALRALLARETPPRVKVPERNVITTTAGARDLMWIAAIRAAGGEVDG